MDDNPFQRFKAEWLYRRDIHRQKKRAAKTTTPTDWRTLKFKQFRREHGKELALRAVCHRCAGPMSEPMLHCPWCGDHKKVYQGESTFPQRCGRCGRGQKLDWRFCAWCYGGKLEPETNREYTDVRYEAFQNLSRCNVRHIERRVLSDQHDIDAAKVERRRRVENGMASLFAL